MFDFFGRKRLKIECRSICDRGLARNDNQDCVFASADAGLFCVADGMGGADGGALASRIVCRCMEVVPSGGDFERRIFAVDRAILAANAEVRRRAAGLGFERMGSTAAVLLVDPAVPARAAIANVGDSRVYRRRGIRLECLTEDHRNGAYSHLLTKAVGAADSLEPDWVHASVCRGDVWLVCSDGVHEMVPDSTINALIARGGPASEIAARIEDCVRRAGARDNYSIVVVRT